MKNKLFCHETIEPEDTVARTKNTKRVKTKTAPVWFCAHVISWFTPLFRGNGVPMPRVARVSIVSLQHTALTDDSSRLSLSLVYPSVFVYLAKHAYTLSPFPFPLPPLPSLAVTSSF